MASTSDDDYDPFDFDYSSTAKPSPAMEETPNWLEMPQEFMRMILQRLGAVEILKSAQKVCTTWRRVCKDPAMWNVIDLHDSVDSWDKDDDLVKLAKMAVHRSCGELIDISIEGFGSDDLLDYISRCSSKLNDIRLVNCYDITSIGLSHAVKRLPHLQQLHLFYTEICAEDIEVIGRGCPLLKSFKMNTVFFSLEKREDDVALAIANNMPELRHLQLFGSWMTNDGLQAILHGCPHLESLDLRRCYNLNLGGSLRDLCIERIKDLKRPFDLPEICGFYLHVHDYDPFDFDYSSTAEPSPAMEETPNWLEMPQELMGMILQRLGAVEILKSAQKVCTTWRRVCKDPAMWNVIDLHDSVDSWDKDDDLVKLAKQAVHRSCGELIDVSIECFGTDDLLDHISRCSSKLNFLGLVNCYNITSSGLSHAVKRLPHLEKLHLFYIEICGEDIEVIGRCCPLLKSFQMNKGYTWLDIDCDDHALAIANNMPELRDLQLIYSKMTNNGLQAILQGCPHLKSLDLRRCFNLNLDGNLGKLCMERIKDLKLPLEPTEYCGFDYDFSDDESSEDGFYDHDNSDYYCDYVYSSYKEYIW